MCLGRIGRISILFHEKKTSDGEILEEEITSVEGRKIVLHAMERYLALSTSADAPSSIH